MSQPTIRQIIPFIEVKKKNIQSAIQFMSGEVCRVSPAQAEKAKNYGNKIKELKYLLSIKK